MAGIYICFKLIDED